MNYENYDKKILYSNNKNIKDYIWNQESLVENIIDNDIKIKLFYESIQKWWLDTALYIAIKNHLEKKYFIEICYCWFEQDRIKEALIVAKKGNFEISDYRILSDKCLKNAWPDSAKIVLNGCWLTLEKEDFLILYSECKIRWELAKALKILTDSKLFTSNMLSEIFGEEWYSWATQFSNNI